MSRFECSGCGSRSCDGRCFDEEPDGTLCQRCNDQPAIEDETLCIYCDRLLSKQVERDLRFVMAMPAARAASLRPQSPAASSRSGIAIAKGAR